MAVNGRNVGRPLHRTETRRENEKRRIKQRLATGLGSESREGKSRDHCNTSRHQLHRGLSQYSLHDTVTVKKFMFRSGLRERKVVQQLAEGSLKGGRLWSWTLSGLRLVDRRQHGRQWTNIFIAGKFIVKAHKGICRLLRIY